MADAYNELAEAVKLYNPVTVQERTPEEEAEDKALEERSAFARKYLSRDLRSEANTEAASGLPKNRLLRALAGFGIGVNDYFAEQNKRPTFRDKIYNEIKGEWEKKAPLLERDIQASESIQGRRQLALAKRMQDAQLANAKAQQWLMEYALKNNKNAAEVKLIQANEAFKNAKTDTEKELAAQAALKTKHINEFGVEMGRATPSMAEAIATGKNPELASGINNVRVSEGLARALPGMLRESVKAPGGGTTTTTTLKKFDTTNGPFWENVPSTSVRSGADNRPAARAALLDIVGALQGRTPAAALPGVLGGAAVPAAPAAPVQTTPAAPAINRVLQKPQVVPTAPPTPTLPPPQAADDPYFPKPARPAGIPAGARYYGPKAPTAQEKTDSNNRVSVMQDIDTVLSGFGTADKNTRNFFNEFMGPHMALGLAGVKASTFADWLAQGTPHALGFKKLIGGNLGAQWSTALAKSGKTLSPAETAMLNRIAISMTEDKKFPTDKPHIAFGTAVAMKLGMELMDYKERLRASIPGTPEQQEAILKSENYADDIDRYVKHITNRWIKGEKIDSSEITLRKAVPKFSQNPFMRNRYAGNK